MEPWKATIVGRYDEHEIDSKALRGNALGDPHLRPLWVYVPPGYDASRARYPLAMLLAGYGSTNHSLLNYDFFQPNPVERWFHEHNALVQEFASIDGAFAALLDRQVDAVVFDAPVLLYYSTHGGRGRVTIVGSTFHKEDYGIVFQSNGPLRKQVNAALLALREDGTYQQIYDKWFGSK